MTITKKPKTFFQSDDSRSGNSRNKNPTQGGKRAKSSRNRDKKGFARMVETPEGAERQREIASQGGTAAHEYGNAHEWDANEAREAGRKGGKARSKNRRKNRNNNNQ